ncbi:hypothetical protein A3F28_01395 [Candidatus Uhrbacteria bacterium RIFCSPHIGHO2_12_FULL_57_11]|uniref:Polysaccharide biosynthesis protein C-terminal domain-containing protein n=1 Tax=Candidatus Uhrbacteria bacterium RIFCSPHIGHO2_12_FULL_57_11 TaxID=1802398 RepID=A0A1F7UHQ0_9BACT|nr:MAG: hypothetical protein A3F28_01395 [Candidatus Uhrbacteria bacterium RIFCSPHIGHO2_12_FULL_57_11]
MSSIRSTIAKGTTLLTAGNVLSRFISLATVIVVTRGLSLRDYGLVALALAAAGPVFSITSLGMDEMVVSDTARAIGEGRPGRARAILRSFMALRFFLLAVLLAAGWILRGYLTARYGSAFSTYFWILALYLIIQEIRTLFQIIFQVGKRFAAVAAGNAGELLVKLASVLVFAAIGGLSVENILASHTIAAGVVLMASIPAFLNSVSPIRSVRAETGAVLIPILRSHGKWQAAQSVLSDAISSARYFLINTILSTESVAVFSVAQSMYSAAASFFPLKFVLFPILAGVARQEERARQLVARATKYSLLFYTSLMILVWVAAGPIIGLLFPKYLVGIPILMLMALRLPLNSFSIAQAPVLTVFREQRAQMLFTAASGVSMLVLLPPLMRRFSLVGTVVEGLITVSLVIVIREIYLRHKHHLSSVTTQTLFRIDALDRALLNEIRSGIVRLLSRRAR